MTADKPSVLFVCVHDAGRSQMAAGWLHPIRDEIGGRIRGLLAELVVPVRDASG